VVTRSGRGGRKKAPFPPFRCRRTDMLKRTVFRYNRTPQRERGEKKGKRGGHDGYSVCGKKRESTRPLLWQLVGEGTAGVSICRARGRGKRGSLCADIPRGGKKKERPRIHLPTVCFPSSLQGFPDVFATMRKKKMGGKERDTAFTFARNKEGKGKKNG